KITNPELADVGVLKRAAEIFRPSFDPALTDENLWSRNLTAKSSQVFGGLDVDRQVVFGDVIANEAALVIGRAEEDVDLAQVADGSLSINIELAQRFDVVAEELHSNRQRRLPRIKINNSAADGELPTSRHL